MLYPDFIHAHLGKAARVALEKLMDLENYVPMSPLFRKHYFRGIREGKKEGKAEARAEQAEQARGLLLRLMKRKGLRVSAAARARIAACEEPETLTPWAEQVVTAERLADVFAGVSAAR